MQKSRLGHPTKWQVLILPSFQQNSERTYVEGPTDQILAISDHKLTFLLDVVFL